MTKEEILEKIWDTEQMDGDILYYREHVLKVMDQYGRQCFEAGIKCHSAFILGDYKYDIDKFWKDYLKEIEQ